MSSRSIRRALERKAKKQARKAERLAVAASPAALQTDPAPQHSTEPPAPASDFSPITPAQLAANRANALLSSGPRTSAGKARSSKNAVKTALTGRTVLLPTDDVDEYAAFVAGFEHDLAPVGQAESELVQSIVDCFWRLRRIRALEFALYAHGHEQFEHAFDDRPAEDRSNMILLQTHMTYEMQFRNFNIQEARLDRKYARDIAELQRLQADRTRVTAEEEPLDEEDDAYVQATFARYRAILANQRTKSQSENGFVFSNGASAALASASETSPTSQISLASDPK
jgi:hypothetical protein